MVINILPRFCRQCWGIKTNIIGIIEGIAEATSSILKVFSGWLSDRLRTRKVVGCSGLRAFALRQALLLLSRTAGAPWQGCAGQTGLGKASAPLRADALVADNVKPEQRGLAFGLTARQIPPEHARHPERGVHRLEAAGGHARYWLSIPSDCRALSA
jgi:MFS family permease